MRQLVYIEHNKTVTDSLTVSEVFGKEHRRVMQDIRELECSEDFRLHHFVQSTYLNGQDRPTPKYIITEQGFTLLAMGYTGKEAMRFKEQYIAEFERMREQLTKTPVLSERQALIQSLKLTAELAEDMDEIKTITLDHGNKINDLGRKLETQITLNSSEQRRIQKAVNVKVYSTATDQEERSELFRQLHKEIKDRWQVPSYKDILRQDLQGVLQYIAAWVPVRRAG